MMWDRREVEGRCHRRAYPPCVFGHAVGLSRRDRAPGFYSQGSLPTFLAHAAGASGTIPRWEGATAPRFAREDASRRCHRRAYPPCVFGHAVGLSRRDRAPGFYSQGSLPTPSQRARAVASCSILGGTARCRAGRGGMVRGQWRGCMGKRARAEGALCDGCNGAAADVVLRRSGVNVDVGQTADRGGAVGAEVDE